MDGRAVMRKGARVGEVITGRGVEELFADFFRRETGRELDEAERERLTAALGRVNEGNEVESTPGNDASKRGGEVA